MKPVVKQKLSTLQDIINNAQSGGGGTVDAYTKAEADAKFETITGAAAAYLSKADAANTYLSKSDATNMPNKIIVALTQAGGQQTILQATIDDVAFLSFEGAIFTFCIYAEGLEENYYFTSTFFSFNNPTTRRLMFFKDNGTPEDKITITIYEGIATIYYDITDADYNFISGKLSVIF